MKKLTLASALFCTSLLFAGSLASPAHADPSGDALDFARLMQSYSNDTDFEEHFSGVYVDEANGVVYIYWVGSPSRELEQLITLAPGDVQVVVHQAEFTSSQERSAAETLTAILSKAALNTNLAIFERFDGLGLDVETPQDSANEISRVISLFMLSQEVPVRVTVKGMPQSTSNRTNDSAPYHGGATFGVGMFATWGMCTTGFGVHNASTGVPYILTAHHCFIDAEGAGNTSIGTYTDSGALLNYWAQTGTWKNVSGYNAPNVDAALIRPSPSSSSDQIYIGGAASGTLRTISSALDPVPGETICVEGAATGEHCNLKIKSINGSNLTFNLASGQFTPTLHNITETYASTGTAVGEGDSGGPIYDYNTASQTYVGLGTVVGGSGNFNCGTRTCFHTLYFSQLPQELSDLGMALN